MSQNRFKFEFSDDLKKRFMNWELELIGIYFKVCEYGEVVRQTNTRYSNNQNEGITDLEIITIYFYCHTQGRLRQDKKKIHKYAAEHLHSWFPKLPDYPAFNKRLNQLSACFVELAALFRDEISKRNEYLGQNVELAIDSCPIMLAKSQRSATAKVARDVANMTYCSTKKMWYHGVKIHVAGQIKGNNTLPDLYTYAVTPGAEHDLKAFKSYILPQCPNATFWADSAYLDGACAPSWKQNFNVTVNAIEKRKKGQKELHVDQKWLNFAISQIRQPIEGLFNQIIELTSIQNASKCRSTKGLLTHIHAKIAAFLINVIIFNG